MFYWRNERGKKTVGISKSLIQGRGLMYSDERWKQQQRKKREERQIEMAMYTQ